jgi:superfamily II DNA or RNA helicase
MLVTPPSTWDKAKNHCLLKLVMDAGQEVALLSFTAPVMSILARVCLPKNFCPSYHENRAFDLEQLEYLVHCLKGKEDGIFVLRTGAGKSAAWLVHSKVFLQMLCVVITPFIMLLQDQLESVKKKGIMGYAFQASGPPVPNDAQILFLEPESVNSLAFHK